MNSVQLRSTESVRVVEIRAADIQDAFEYVYILHGKLRHT
jgi:hypothetical protein